VTRKAVFITGAARGIGRAAAEHFAQDGWFVGLYDVDAKGVAEAAKEIAASTGESTTTSGVLDVTDPKAWHGCLEQFWTEAGERLDVLVNNAGILTSGEFVDTPASRQAAVVDVNVKGVLFGCHTAFPYLRRTPTARVVNLCSTSAAYGMPGLATYSATKAAVRALTEALDLEWASHGIRVCDIWPLVVATDMGAQTLSGSRYKRFGANLRAEDVARSVVDAAEHPSWLFQPHHMVGLQSKFAALASWLLPPQVTREVVNRLVR
jgi:NAD(P)-dependent dehydrogenase (short-subunit alcohol dehydrogenase family)